MTIFNGMNTLNKYFSLVLSFFFLTLTSMHGRLEKPKLAEFKSDVFSQFGEDGIIDQIFKVIGTKSKICIEFGAWDGFYLSNTAKLFSQEDWHAILIECDPIKYRELVKNVKKFNCICICQVVGVGCQSIESILKKNRVSFSEIDLLSIDIDGNDYHIFESLKNLRPRLIVCEYNPTLPAHLDIFADYGNLNNLGCSVGALVRLGKEKKYTLVALTDTNAFFLRNDEIKFLNNFEIKLDKIKVDRYIHYFITDFTGKHAIITSKENITPYGKTELLTTEIFGNTRKLN